MFALNRKMKYIAAYALLFQDKKFNILDCLLILVSNILFMQLSMMSRKYQILLKFLNEFGSRNYFIVRGYRNWCKTNIDFHVEW